MKKEKKEDKEEKMEWWDYLVIGLVFPPFICIFLEWWILSGIFVLVFFASIFLVNYMEKKKEEEKERMRKI